VQSLLKGPGMGRVEDGEPVHDLRVIHRGGPRGGSTPVVPHQQRRLGTAFSDQAPHVVGQPVGGVGGEAIRFR
jgi:hypothetical protein